MSSRWGGRCWVSRGCANTGMFGQVRISWRVLSPTRPMLVTTAEFSTSTILDDWSTVVIVGWVPSIRVVVVGFGLYTRRIVRRLGTLLHERLYLCMVVDPGFSKFRPIYRSLFCNIWSLPSQRVCHIWVSWWRCHYQYKSLDTLWFLW